MASVLVQFRVDSELKEQMAAVCDRIGLDMNSALRLFMKRTVMENGIPFEMKQKKEQRDLKIAEQFVSLVEKEAGNNETADPDMSLDEINAIISECRREADEENEIARQASEAIEKISRRRSEQNLPEISDEEIIAEVYAARSRQNKFKSTVKTMQQVSEKSGNSDMTLDEINREIAMARAERDKENKAQ